MQWKLFSCNVAAPVFYSCCFQILFWQITLCASINEDASSTAACSSSSSMPCAKLGKISYPFWGSASCAASPSYVLSNCTSPSNQAYWDSFSDAAVGVVGSPAVTAIGEEYGSSSIQVSWNKTLMDGGFCGALLPSTNLSLYNIPSSINLTRMPDSSSLSFGSDFRYLLFNCTADHYTFDFSAYGFHHHTSDFNAFRFYRIPYRYREVPTCNRYRESCASPNAKVTCIELQPDASAREIMLQRAVESLACSHFILGTSNRYQGDYPYGQWITGSIELSWTDTQCQKCERQANGYCIFDATVLSKFKHCECIGGNAVDFNTQTCVYTDICSGGLLQCSTGAKVGVGVAATVVVLGMLVVIGVKCWRSPNLWSMIRGGIRDGCLGFIKVIISIAINVLRSSLRKLQSVSIGPHISLNTTDLEGLTERPMEFSYSSIASATKSFGNLVGEGGFGRVYKGAMTVAGRSKSHHDGHSTEMQVAVKVLEVRSKHSKQQFLNEVITIGRIHHVNVVRLLGFCMQEDHEMLVYEYVANGSLDRWLFEKKLGESPDQKQQVLDWEQRYAIALGIARGLSYLHEECRHRTVHCDIKPHNILLDENMCPKIADFGLARLMGRDESKVVTFVKGTPGYMAPEFWMGGEGHLSTKFDVYSYGMVLLELVSGQRNFRRDAVAASECSSFPARAFEAVMEGDLESILDARLQGIVVAGDGEKQEQFWKQIKTMVLVALWCIQDQPGRRPWMSEVVKFLEGGAAVSDLKCPPQPNISTFAAQSADPEQLTLGSNYDHEDCTPLSVGR